MITKLEGIILNETPYGETSKIINVLTKEKGIVGIMCKGAKSMKNSLRALTMPLTYGYFYVYYKEDKLSTLKDVDLINSFNNIKQDILLIAYANYLTELTHQITKIEFDENIYELFINSLIKIDSNIDPLIITNIVELQYLKYLGIELNLNECVNCGSTKNIITLDGDIGGFICNKCYTNEKMVSLKAIKLIRMYNAVDIKSISSININDNSKYEINYFLNRYYDRYTGLYLKSKKFLEDLNKIG